MVIMFNLDAASLLYHLLSDVITCTMLSEKYFVIIITRLYNFNTNIVLYKTSET